MTVTHYALNTGKYSHNDLFLAAMRFYRLLITDRSATVGVRAELGDTKAVRSAIERAAYLAERFENALARSLDQSRS